MSKKKRRVRRLLSKGRRGILRGIFSRGTIIVLLILLQVVFLYSSIIWLEQYRFHWDTLSVILGIGAVYYLVNSEMDALSRITWLLLIVFTPILGVLFLVYTRLDIGVRTMKQRVQSLTAEAAEYLPENEHIMEELKEQHSTTYNLAKYFQRSRGNFPVYTETASQYFPTGESKFEKLKSDLRQAKKYIFIEYFIIDEGIMWGEVLHILEQKAKEGLEIRVLYDGMNEFSTLTFDYAERLEAIGIQAKSFAPIRPFVSTYYNYRDHRKIVVIDGEVAYTGGVNLADEYINEIDRFGHWKDTAVRLQGKAVDSLLIMFLQMWHTTGELPEFESYLGKHDVPIATDGYVIPYGDSPLDEDRIGENVYIDILNHARDYVYIMTPYLILSTEMEHAIKFAAERGVSVKIIVPGIPDKKAPYALAKTYFAPLMKSGVQIYTYTPGFMHAKVFLSDDHKAVVGTINLDYRSLYHHFECATYFYKASLISDIYSDFEETLLQSELVTAERLLAEPLNQRLLGTVIKAIAPLL